MAKRVALIPEEFISSYHHFQKPDKRLEDEIGLVLEKANLADDMKVKLLSILCAIIKQYIKFQILSASL